ncbi:MAG: MBL fold metallo-hydrolase [Clostridia bacterium]|nr:MBL fold metallo-hydrolase [Clostridia bacterium]
MIILTSSLNLYEKDENGIKKAQKFPNDNDILGVFRKNIKKYENFLFVASLENEPEITENYARLTFESFSKTLPFFNYRVLDGRSASQASELIKNADFIFLSGGHLPTQNAFFNKINLKNLLQNTEALICGGSAGSMNCADIVYCPPEIEGESLDKNFKRYLKGLGFTNINILPHFEDFENFVLDGKNYIEEIILPDTYKNKVLAIPDGSYIVIDEKQNKSFLYGEGYMLDCGKITKINNDGQVKDVTDLEVKTDIEINSHSSILINKDIYVDPFNITKKGEAKYIFITHSHYDHFSPQDIQKIITEDTILICPQNMENEMSAYDNKKVFVLPNQKYSVGDLHFETFASYNLNKKFHPKDNLNVGYIVDCDGEKIAIVGDSDNTEELQKIKTDVLLIPIGGTYTMTVSEAVLATKAIKPKLAIPTHYGSIVGDKNLGEEFEKQIAISNIKCKILI